jgi:hypothetical protein
VSRVWASTVRRLRGYADRVFLVLPADGETSVHDAATVSGIPRFAVQCALAVLVERGLIWIRGSRVGLSAHGRFRLQELRDNPKAENDDD